MTTSDKRGHRARCGGAKNKEPRIRGCEACEGREEKASLGSHPGNNDRGGVNNCVGDQCDMAEVHGYPSFLG